MSDAAVDNDPHGSVEWEVTADILTDDGEIYRVDVNGTHWQVASRNSAFSDESPTWKVYNLEKFVAGNVRARRYPINTPDGLWLALNNNAFICMSAPVTGGQSNTHKSKDIILSTASIKRANFYQNPRTPLP